MEYLKELWESQNGICPYTGWRIKNYPTMLAYEKAVKTPDTASLDRINSKEGYIPGNVEFVSLLVNYAKNNWDKDTLVEIFFPIREKFINSEVVG